MCSTTSYEPNGSGDERTVVKLSSAIATLLDVSWRLEFREQRAHMLEKAEFGH